MLYERSIIYFAKASSRYLAKMTFRFGFKKSFDKCGALRDLVPFVQFKKHEKHPWRSVNFSKVAGFKPATLLKLTLLHGCFSRFF